MKQIYNPQAVRSSLLGVAPALRFAIQKLINDYFITHSDLQFIDETALRALHPLLSNDAIWALIVQEMGLYGTSK